jgi:hypothetical protein
MALELCLDLNDQTLRLWDTVTGHKIEIYNTSTLSFSGLISFRIIRQAFILLSVMMGGFGLLIQSSAFVGFQVISDHQMLIVLQ